MNVNFCYCCCNQQDKYIVCKRCRTKIANIDKLFAMSKEGIRTNFCNPGERFVGPIWNLYLRALRRPNNPKLILCSPILQLDRFMKRIPSPRHCRRWRSLVVHYQRNLVGFPGIHGVMCIVHCVTAIWAGNIIRKICDREHLLDWPVWAFCLRISVQRRTIKMKS